MATYLTLHASTVKLLKCRHGCDDPIGVFYVPEGCSCFEDKIQALCDQHLNKLPDVPCLQLISRTVGS